MQEGKVGPTIHKSPVTSEQLQQLYETRQRGEWDTLASSQLLRTAWFYIICYLGKRGHENQCGVFGVQLKGDVTMNFVPFCL